MKRIAITQEDKHITLIKLSIITLIFIKLLIILIALPYRTNN